MGGDHHARRACARDATRRDATRRAREIIRTSDALGLSRCDASRVRIWRIRNDESHSCGGVGEIFPTSVRGAGFGLCNVGARVGGVLAPYALVLPSSVTCAAFGTLALVASELTRRSLVETLGRPLPTVMIEDEPPAPPARW